MMKRVLASLVVIALVVVGVVLAFRARDPAPATEAEAGDTPATVVSVRVAPIVLTTLRGYVDTWGTVEPQPASAAGPPASAGVASPVAGIIAQVSCAEGSRVVKGATLFSLDSRVADVAVARATQAVQFAEQAFDRQKKLGAGEATSQKLYQEAEQNAVTARADLSAARMQRALLDIPAPLSGTVVKVHAQPGDAVDLTTRLAEIIDLDRLVVTAGVRTADLARVRLGQRVTLTAATPAVTAPPAPARDYAGTIVFLGARIDSGTDTAPVRVSLSAGAGVRPGQFLSVRIAVEERRDRLAVPVESVVSENGATVIAVVEGDTAVRRPVTVGLRDGDLVEVSGAGLKAGLRVVTTGAYGLPSGSRITVSGR